MIKFKELLFLNNIKGVGKATIYKRYWDALNNSNNLDELYHIVNKNFKRDKIELDKSLKKANLIYNIVEEDPEMTVITVFDDNYPEKLRDMGNKRPIMLFVKGNVDVLSKPNIAIIGTRKPSPNSKNFEQSLVQTILDNSDRVVVSGLALGCDQVAHKTTVDKKRETIAVLPSGLNNITPPSNKGLAGEIIEQGGCLITEYEPNMKVNRGSYVARDAIVAAFSDITFVVECGIKSGTMHTVNACLEYKEKVDYSRELYCYLPEDESLGEYMRNKFILENGNSTKVTDDLESFSEELVILEKPVVKSRKNNQSNLNCLF